MTKLYMYVVTAAPDPRCITCTVPYRVNEKEIFFGACKKRLRAEFRLSYLNPQTETMKPWDSIYLAGINGGNRYRVRKIIWAGRVKKIMTFGHAFNNLNAAKYKKMRTWNKSPIHVKPIFKGDRFIGYEHISEMHKENDSWIVDLIAQRNCGKVKLSGNKLIVNKGYDPWDAFPRDSCLLLENIFFTQGQAIDIDKKILSILRKAQPKDKIDEYAVFGYRKDGSADGLTGSYLCIEGKLAESLIHHIQNKTANIKEATQKHQSKARCC